MTSFGTPRIPSRPATYPIMTSSIPVGDIPRLLQKWKQQNERVLGHSILQSESSVFLQIDEIGIVSLCVAIDHSSHSSAPDSPADSSAKFGTYANAYFDSVDDAVDYLQGSGSANWITDERRQ